MACGCKGGMKGIIRSRVPTVARPNANRVTTQSTPSVQSQSIQAQSATDSLSSDARTMERKRREAILRKLGRL